MLLLKNESILLNGSQWTPVFGSVCSFPPELEIKQREMKKRYLHQGKYSLARETCHFAWWISLNLTFYPHFPFVSNGSFAVFLKGYGLTM